MRFLLQSCFCLSVLSWASLLAQTDRPIFEAGKVEQRSQNRRSISADGLITVYADKPEVRSAVLSYVESIRRDILSLYLTDGQADKWSHPIILEIHNPVPGQQKRSLRKQLLNTPSGYRLQLDLWLESGLDREALAREFISFLVIENGLRKPDHSPGVSWASPPWLTEGLLEALVWKNNKGDRELYDAVMKSNAGLGVDKLFETQQLSELDPISRNEFRIWAGALVMSIVESSPDNRRAFPAFLAEVGSFVGEPTLLLGKHFPDRNISESSLKKWVALKIANLSQARTTDVLTVRETDQRLDTILIVEKDRGDGEVEKVSLWTHLEELDEKERVEERVRRTQQLMRLSYRCFPLMRSVVSDYAELVAQPPANEQKRSKVLDELTALRERLIRDADRARDVLDWYELNTGSLVTGDLDDYLKLKGELKASETDRKDGVSWYLDQVDRLRGGSQKGSRENSFQSPLSGANDF